MAEPFSGWIANLSNGMTAKEGETPEGGSSPWQELKKYCEEQGVHLTQIRLHHAGMTLVGVPNADGYLAATLVFKRMYADRESHKRGIVSIVGDKAFAAWIDIESMHVFHEVSEAKDYEGLAILRPAKE